MTKLKLAPNMSTEDAPAEGLPAAGNVDVPASAESVDTGCLIAFESGAPLQPRWLRPTITLIVILAHAAALFALSNVSPPAPPAEKTIDVDVIAAGDDSPVTTSAAQAAQPSTEVATDAKPEQSEASAQPPAAIPAPPPETPTPVVATPEPTPPPAPEPPPSPDAPPPPAASQEAPAPPPSPEAPRPAAAPPIVATPIPAPEALPAQPPPMSIEAHIQALAPPPPPPDQASPQPQPRPKPQARPEPAERPKPHKPAVARSSASVASASKPGSSEAHRVGEANGRAVDVGMSRASYAALVVAQIQAHRFYPDSARSRGEQGAVGVSFTIGPNGRVGSAAVLRSSGFAELDNAAREILRSISPPPPPGGSFSASTTIRFHFE